MKLPKPDHPYYVSVRDAATIRKDLLQGTKDILEGLKGIGEYQRLRLKKLELIAELKRTVDQLVVLNRKLRSRLPQPWLSTPAERARTALIERPVRERFEEHAHSKVDLIENELARIEERLAQLEK